MKDHKADKHKLILAIILPLLFGLLAALILRLQFADSIPVVQLRIDLASLAILVSIPLSLYWVWRVILNTRHEAHTRDLIAAEKEEHKQFLMRLDHELKNPLSAIKTAASFLEQLSLDIEPRPIRRDFQKSLAQISALSERINRLILDLRKLAELETYRIELVSVDVNQLLHQLVADASTNPTGADKKISLSLPGAPWQLPNLFTDEDLLYLCLSNMMNNAMKYTPAQGNIEVRAYENREAIFIEIADSGVGIPPDEIDKVWGKLYRARNSRGVPGNGLGLSIVEIIVRRLQGSCDLRSQENTGTVFTLQLPKTKSSQA
ncbi:MAG: two-component system, OmpR family, phosphate regulon sensor histidine kinase PhoR [Chloroflexota bacterium]|nr:two-component system, OmpR family, phosphate regulon sensor histidine kinase PhoR [Chloroflexota bacterium]